MVDNKIIKALKCCKVCSTPEDCSDCPYVECPTKKGCVGEMIADAIDLIKRQQAEIEGLNKLVLEKHKEINRLDDYIQYVRVEAIKEFAERLVAIYENDETYDRPNAHTLVITLFRNIDNLLKKMMKGNNNEDISVT